MIRQSQVVWFALQESLKPHKHELTSQLLGQMWQHQDVCALSHIWTGSVCECVSDSGVFYFLILLHQGSESGHTCAR